MSAPCKSSSSASLRLALRARQHLVILALAVACFASPPSTAMASESESSSELCCEFVKHSVSFQKSLAEKIQRSNNRDVYLFDASGFSGSFEDQMTPAPDNVRYKTGTLNGTQVDAVLSVSAQRSVSGSHGAHVFKEWLGPDPRLDINQYGVYLATGEGAGA